MASASACGAIRTIVAGLTPPCLPVAALRLELPPKNNLSHPSHASHLSHRDMVGSILCTISVQRRRASWNHRQRQNPVVTNAVAPASPPAPPTLGTAPLQSH